MRAQSCLLLSTSWTVICKLHPAWNFLRKNSRVVAISCSRGSSQPRDQTHISCISCIGKQILYHCTTWEAHSGHACFFLCSWNRPGSFLPQDLCTSFHAHKIMSSIKVRGPFQPAHLYSKSSLQKELSYHLKRAALQDDGSDLISLECVSCFTVILFFCFACVCALSSSHV